MLEKTDGLQAYLNQPQKIVITTHQKPDGDAMGSSLGWLNYLKNKGHEVTVVTPTEYPDNFKWLPGNEHVLIYPDKKDEAELVFKNATLICCLDFNVLQRIAPLDEFVRNSTSPVLLIDHHLQPDEFQWMFHDVAACSTCELVFRLIHLLEENPTLTLDIARCLFTGLLTDTGNFSNGATSEMSFKMAAALLATGLKVQDIHEQLNQNTTESKLRFLGNSLLNKMTVNHELGIAFIVVDRKDARTFNLQAGDTEGLVNYPLTMPDIVVSVLIKEEKDIVKLSFRSKGELSVNDFARAHFEGGGHRNAAGGKSILPSALLIKKITELFEKQFKKKK